jgi:hypothetical protein
MEPRKAAKWIAMDDEHTDDPGLYSWGDWHIARDGAGGLWHLIVTSGVEYGPFTSLEAAKQHAENVRGD